MAYILLGMVLLAGFLLAGRWYVQADPKLIIKSFKWFLITIVLLVALYFLISGRVGLALAALPALLPWFFRLRMAAKIAKTLHGMSQKAKGNNWSNNQDPRKAAGMTAKEAYEVLGIDEGASAEKIREAHRHLIANVHPDKGGSTYLAAKINMAKDVLLG